MKWILSLFGPIGTFLGAALDFVLAHWKFFLAALAVALVLGWTFMQGEKHSDATWQKKWAARDAEDKIVEDQHKQIVAGLDAAIDKIDADATAAQAGRTVTYNKIDEEVKKYVAVHSVPALPGVCPTDTDIGDDGVLLIQRAIAARLPGADQGHGSGDGGVPAPQ